MRKILIIAAFIALAGCQADNIKADYQLNVASGHGVAVGALTYQGDYAGYQVLLRDVETGEMYTISHGDAQTLNLKLAFKGEDVNPDLGATGSAFAVDLPEGDYTVAGWHIGQGAARVDSTEPTNIAFHVVAGKAIYLGNFHFTETARTGRAIARATLSLFSNAARDITAVYKTYPAMQAVRVDQALAADTHIDNIGGQSEGTLTVPIFGGYVFVQKVN